MGRAFKFRLELFSLLSCALLLSDPGSIDLPITQIRKQTEINPKKILVMSFANIGGHASVAKAILSHSESSYAIDILDLDDIRNGPKSDYYANLQKSEWFLYIHNLSMYLSFILLKASRFFPRWLLEKQWKIRELEELIRKNNYDLVIFLEPNHPHELNYYCYKHEVPCITIMTDYGEPDIATPYWIRGESMVYLIPDRALTDQASNYHSVYRLSGIPLRPEFANIRNRSKAEIKQELGLDVNKKCGLVFFGAAGSEAMFEIAQVCQEVKDKQFVFLCGTHKQLKERIEAMGVEHFVIKGFLPNPSDYLRAADVLIGKPGGLSVTEAIEAETPCIFRDSAFFSVAPIERINIEYMKNRGYCIVVTSHQELIQAIDKALSKDYTFHANNALAEAVLITRRILREGEKWVRRMYT